jgi:hypothetical protein
VKFDTTQISEGHYQVVARSLASKVQSQTREFFVINHIPKLALSFRGAPGTNLNQPLKGRPEFLIQTETSPVPFQRIEFRAIDANGKIVSSKKNDYVLSNMKMGWRTSAIPNGQYQIYFHGEISYLGKLYMTDSPVLRITIQN